MKRLRATCSICGKTLLLSAEGEFRLHQITWRRPRDSDCPIKSTIGPCDGSFSKPAIQNGGDQEGHKP